MQKFVVKLALAFWVALICNVTLINLGLHGTPTYDIFIVNVVGNVDSWLCTVFKCVYGIVGIYTSVLWLAPSFVEVAIGYLLHSELKLFRLSLADKIEQGR